MTFRFTTSRAIGTAIALTIAGAGTAAAQSTTSLPPTPAGQPSPAAPTTSETPGAPADTRPVTTLSQHADRVLMGRDTVRADTTRGTTTGTATGTMGGTTSGSTSGTMNGTTSNSMNGSTSGSTSGSMSGSSMSGSSMNNSSSMGGSSYNTTTSTSAGEVSSSRRVRVRKDQGYTTSTSGGDVSREPMAAPAPAPAPEPAPMAVAPAPVFTPAPPPPAPEPLVYTPESAQPPVMGRPGARFGNGLYFGLQGGANFPQNEIDPFYDTGLNLGAQLGWDPTNSPLGLRLNANYNRLNGRNIATSTGGTTTTSVDLKDAELYSAFADAKLRLPFGRFLGATSGLYGVGGVGLTHFRNYQNFGAVTGIPGGGSVVNLDPEGNRNVTRFAINGGGGLSWGIGNVSLFVEGRYVRVFTQNRDTDYVPVTIGLTFH